MKKNVMTLFLTFLTMHLFAKNPIESGIDPRVQERFKIEFGSSIKVSWKNIQNMYVGTFVDQGEEKQAYYFTNGEFFGLGKVISRELFPLKLKNSINRKFKEGVIQTVYKLEGPDFSVLYFVRLVTPTSSTLIQVNQTGDIEIQQKAEN